MPSKKTPTIQLKQEFMLCRDLMHPWEPYTAKRVDKGFERTLACPRCGTYKTQVLSAQGFVLRTRISYPPGYLLPKGSGPLTSDARASLRVQNLKEFD